MSLLQATIGILILACSSHAAVVSWWRFEAGEDSDTNAKKLTNANEVSGQPAMISSNATIGTDVPDLFDDFVPGAGVANTGSVRSYKNGDGGDGIFGTAAYSSVLDVASITVEFWMRTTENEAGFVARTTVAGNAGEDEVLTNGFRIVDPNDVRVNFWTHDGSGGSTSPITLTSGTSVNNGNWHYIAFTYNSDDGVSHLYIDDPTTPAVTNNGADNRPLYWGGSGAQPQVHIGYQMDGNPNNNTGTLDEIRFSDLALTSEDLLITPVPEPATVAAGGLLTAWLAWEIWKRRKVTAKAGAERYP